MNLNDIRRLFDYTEWANHQVLDEGLSEEFVQRDLSYRNLKGEPLTLPLIEQMQHLVNHATLHRGQVVGMIRQLGIQPPAVDLLYYLITRK
jgi:uncharacterized damage-inducible protein DinB